MYANRLYGNEQSEDELFFKRNVMRMKLNSNDPLLFLLMSVERKTKSLFHRRISEIVQDPIAVSYGWILKYLEHTKDRPVYQRDIERQFHLARSTVTTMMKSLEGRGYIKRQSVESDARLKKIVLTEKGEEYLRLSEEVFDELNGRIRAILSEDEQKKLRSILVKINDGLSDADSSDLMTEENGKGQV